MQGTQTRNKQKVVMIRNKNSINLNTDLVAISTVGGQTQLWGRNKNNKQKIKKAFVPLGTSYW